MTEKKRRPAKKRSGSPPSKSPYFLQPGKQGSVIVLRRPAGNRIDAKLCGTMPSRAAALALVKQLERAESVVKDLFLEATDDGIEALEAVLEACRQSVERRLGHHASPVAAAGPGSGPGPGARRRGRGRRRGSPVGNDRTARERGPGEPDPGSAAPADRDDSGDTGAA